MFRSSPQGIGLQPQVRHSADLRMSWPENLPAEVQGPVTEYLVCIMANKAIDLRYLAKEIEYGNPTHLRKLAYLLLPHGQESDCGEEELPGTM
jgi:hypothetical protein